jgi:hypothetical protein
MTAAQQVQEIIERGRVAAEADGLRDEFADSFVVGWLGGELLLALQRIAQLEQAQGRKGVRA